ncbi:hypothetical protein HDU81_010970 [Chytriomyces hyalinus]|nr:hypothetical protein HDU81_010970 [Chytriomyces hyalinus]
MDFVFCDPPSDAPAVTYDMVLQKLATFYGFSDAAAGLDAVASIIGPPKPKWVQPAWRQPWRPTWELFEGGACRKVLLDFWVFKPTAPNTDEETYCLDFLFSQFIEPFKQEDRCVRWSSSMAPSRCGSNSGSSTPEESRTALELNAENPTHSSFEVALHERDKVCWFCWGPMALDTTLLIPRAPSTSTLLNRGYLALLNRAGLVSEYQVQNGVLLCISCHQEFECLRRYFDVVDGHLVAKIVNMTNDPEDRDHTRQVIRIQRHRKIIIEIMDECGDRTIVNGNNDLPLYFVNNDTSRHPNHIALAFHKAACLIWKMAGALDDLDSDYWDDDTGTTDGVLATVAKRLKRLVAEEDEVPSPTLGAGEESE